MTAPSSPADPLALLDPLRPLVDDWHTHRPLTPRAIINLPSPSAPAAPGCLYSVGLHPWEIEGAGDVKDVSDVKDVLELIEARAAADPAVVAIGEAGLDRLRGPALPLQAQVFEAQVLIAERQRLPLIIHSVRTIPEILAIHRRLRPTVPWIFHGFRGRPEAAAQILRRPGTLISLGPASATVPAVEPFASRGVASGTPAPARSTKPAPASSARAALLAVIPPDRLLRETDAQ